MVFSLFFLTLLRKLNFITYPNFDTKTAIKIFPLIFSFISMVVTGLAALQYVNVPMYSALRRITTCIVMVGEEVILKKYYPIDEQISVYLMVFGAMIGSWGDLTFDAFGYALTTLNCVVTALYLVYIPKKTNETGLTQWGLMYYNNIMSIPFMIVIIYFTEWEYLLQYNQWTSGAFWFCFLASTLQAFLLNYFIFLCSLVNSPLTTSITGQLKNIFQLLLGLVIFHDVIMTVILGMGLAISTLASIWYAIIKYDQQQAKKRSENTDTNTPLITVGSVTKVNNPTKDV